MGRATLRLYYRLPAPAQQLAAWLRGTYLRRWRYGRETDRWVAEAIDQESWSADRWRRWQEERLAVVLHRAATRVPYYRELWAERRRRGDRSSWEVLANWPVLEKEPLRVNPRAFLADDVSKRHLFPEHTSGSTGTPLDLWWTRELVRRVYALNEAYCNRWYGVSRHDRWAMLGGQLIVPTERAEPPFWVWNGALNQLYMSSFHLAHGSIPAYCDALVRYGVRYIAGYTSSLYQLALGVLEHGRRDLHLAAAFTHAEPVTSDQREVIARAFNGAVCETYGNAEGVSRASQCPDGRLHLWPQLGVVETVAGADPVGYGETGTILCTGLRNDAMPIIRFNVGDRGTLADPAAPCSCGRKLPILESVDGRAEDTLYTREGRAILRFHGIVIGVPGVRQTQVIQEALDRVRVRVVPAPDYSAATARLITQKLRDRMGAVDVLVETVESIPRESSGKFRAVVCRLSRQEREALADVAPAATR